MPSPTDYRFHRAILLLSIALFISSLFLVPIQTSANKEPVIGLFLLLWGWLGPLDAVFAWYANPLLFLAWRNYWRGETNLAFRKGIFSAVLASTYLLHKSVLLDEGGGRAMIVSYNLGYWLWLASPIALLVACALSNKGRLLRKNCSSPTQDNAT